MSPAQEMVTVLNFSHALAEATWAMFGRSLPRGLPTFSCGRHRYLGPALNKYFVNTLISLKKTMNMFNANRKYL